MSKGEKWFALSTGSLGPFANLSDLECAWGKEVLEMLNFAGPEVIAWRGWKKTLSEAQEMGLRVAGIHGRTGGEGLIRRCLDASLAPTSDLLSQGKKDGPYVLIHESEARKEEVKEGVIKRAKGLIMIENSTGSCSLESVVEMVEFLRSQNVEAKLMFDLFHYYRYLQSGLEEGWRKTLDKLEEMLSLEAIMGGIHLPLGTDLGDSFPLEQISRGMWMRLKNIREDLELLLVVENQQEMPGALMPMIVRGQRERNGGMIKILGDEGII